MFLEEFGGSDLERSMEVMGESAWLACGANNL